jgi:asparagine synthase (glutamine-hydrolysing)
MCGFVAVVDIAAGVREELLLSMRDELTHRGPDEAGIWISARRDVGFGHQRLSIIDLAAGQQPMSNEDGSVVLAYNGELYNFKALRAELAEAGRRFRTNCDTEVILAAYEEYGDDCLERFDGMFAFAIWDERRRRLFFARDRVGKKPLYYAGTTSGWIFASEIKAILRHPNVAREVDVEALGHYLSFLTTPAPNTLFAGIFKLPAGSCGSWSEDAGLAVRQWWALPTGEPKLQISEADAAEQLRALFAAAVEKRMMSDVPIGVYLSGGVDSSANVAFMSEYSDEPLRTFSVAFAHEPSLDELAHARRVARLFGTNHRELVLSDEDFVACLPRLVHHQDEPIADPVCVPLLHLADVTKASGVTVVQIGEGSDEAFFGYGVHDQAFRRVRRLRAISSLLPRRLLLAALSAGSPLIAEHKYELAVEALRRGLPAPHGVAGLSHHEKERLLRRENVMPAYDYLNSLVGSARTSDEVAVLALEHEFRLRLPELLLMRVDKMTMAASVEARAPFLDHRLVEFASRLPASFHWKDGRGKQILKRALAPVVPQFVLARKKQGFGAPVWRWSSNLRELAGSQLVRRPILEYLNEESLRSLLAAPTSFRQSWELWILLNFALWHRHWIEGEDLREDPQFGRPQREVTKAAAA